MPTAPISVPISLLLKQEREDRYQKQNERELRLFDNRRYSNSNRKKRKQERGVVTVDHTIR